MMALLMPADSLGPGHLFNKYGEPVRAGYSGSGWMWVPNLTLPGHYTSYCQKLILTQYELTEKLTAISHAACRMDGD